MRVILATDSDEIILGQPGHRGAEHDGWWLANDGLEGWYETPKVQADAVSIPNRDGAYWPGTTTLPSRTLTVRGYFSGMSTIEAGRSRDRLAALVAQTVTVTVEDSMGPRHVTGYVSSDVAIDVYAIESVHAFTVTFTCPDPLKYGPDKTVARKGTGDLAIANAGTAPVYPTIEADGVTALTITVGARSSTWSTSSAVNLSIDLRTMIPVNRATGKVVGSVTLSMPLLAYPGEHAITVTPTPATAAVRATSAPGWR